jgi:hypothetical protein
MGDFVQQRRQKRIRIEIFIHRDAMSRIGRPRRPMVAEFGEPGPADPHGDIAGSQ